VFTKARHWSLS